MVADSSVYALLLRDEAMVFPAIVSFIHAIQLAIMAKAVGKLRRKFKVTPPATSGDPGFERGFRAQQNTLEFFPIFITVLWISAKFLNPVLASLTALVYIKGRSDYFSGYAASSSGRLAGFQRCLQSIQLMAAYCVVGITHTALSTYFGINIPQILGVDAYLGLSN